MLDISRIEAGTLSLSPEPVARRRGCSREARRARPAAGRRSALIARGRPRELTTGYVLADHQRLKQVLLNLLSNAIKYNRQGGERARSSAERRPTAACASHVADTGPGIPPEQLRAAVRRRSTGSAPSSSEIEGTGLGLALSRPLVEVMGGTLRSTSRPARGREVRGRAAGARGAPRARRGRAETAPAQAGVRRPRHVALRRGQHWRTSGSCGAAPRAPAGRDR